jgi:hypothetical protein
MKIQVVTLVLGVSASALATAPPALAGPGCVQPHCYVAIAFNQGTGVTGLSGPTGRESPPRTRRSRSAARNLIRRYYQPQLIAR